jgi:anti-sigma B factor antagonist
MSFVDGFQPFTLRLNPHGDAVVAFASGELDLMRAEDFVSELSEELGSGSAVVLDLSGLEFIDSTGLRALLTVAEMGKRNGNRLTIRPELTEAVEELLEISGCRAQLPFAD